MKRQAAIVLIIRNTGVPAFPVGYQREILTVTNRRFRTLTLPGGKVDPGETPLQAAVREVREEINVTVQPEFLRLIGNSVNVVNFVDDREVFLYFAYAIWGTPTHVENGTELHWRSFQHLSTESFFKDFYNRHLPKGIDHLPATKFLGAAT